jgi:hypothetical protein
MQQSYLHILSADNNNNKNELSNFIHAHDSGHPPITAKVNLPGKRGNKQITETKKNETVIMLDLFGALNY